MAIIVIKDGDGIVGSMPESSENPFLARWEYENLEPYVADQPTAVFPDEETIRRATAGLKDDLRVYGAEQLEGLKKFAGHEMTGAEVAYLLLTRVLHTPLRPNDWKLLVETLQEEGLSSTEITDRVLEIQGMAVKQGIREAEMIYDALMPDPVTAHKGHALIKSYKEYYGIRDG